MDKRILITGGAGRLATALGATLDAQGHYVFTPSKLACNITRKTHVEIAVIVRPDIIVNCAGIIPPRTESEPGLADSVNHLGAKLLAQVCYKHNIRLVHISTDAVFSGEFAPYDEERTPSPVNSYGVSKFKGERAVSAECPALILRPAFRHDGPWPFPTAFTDAYRSSVWLSQLLPDMVSAILMPDLTGILHMGGPRRSVYDTAREVSPGVLPGKLEDFKGWRIGRDLTLDCGRWERVKRERGLA